MTSHAKRSRGFANLLNIVTFFVNKDFADFDPFAASSQGILHTLATEKFRIISKAKKLTRKGMFCLSTKKGKRW